MKKMILVAMISGFIGFVAGNAFWYLASPLWIDRVVSEGASQTDAAKVLASGSFADADRAHKGRGTATVYESASGARILRLTDFEVTNGPDLEVWLSTKADITTSQDVLDNKWVALGQLKGNIGDQNYDIPTEVDITTMGSVVIWCEQFSVLFSPATLTFEN